MTFYQLFVIIHIFSAIIGVGPGFVMGYPVSDAETMTALRNGYKARTRIHIPVMVGGFMLLVTGLGMGFLKPVLFTQFWFVGSFVLYLIILLMGPAILRKKLKPIKSILKETKGEAIPPVYYVHAKSLFFYERLTNVLFVIIILLMITKPF